MEQCYVNVHIHADSKPILLRLFFQSRDYNEVNVLQILYEIRFVRTVPPMYIKYYRIYCMYGNRSWEILEYYVGTPSIYILYILVRIMRTKHTYLPTQVLALKIEEGISILRIGITVDILWDVNKFDNGK